LAWSQVLRMTLRSWALNKSPPSLSSSAETVVTEVVTVVVVVADWQKIFQSNEHQFNVWANKLGFTTLAKATTAKRRASLKAIAIRVERKSLALEVSVS
jgi:hypothetical protein